jgi:hypothetical protein
MEIAKNCGRIGLFLTLTWFLGACGGEESAAIAPGTGGVQPIVGTGTAGKAGSITANTAPGQGGTSNTTVAQTGKGGATVGKGGKGGGAVTGKGGAGGSAGKATGAGGSTGNTGGGSVTLPEGHCLANSTKDYNADGTFTHQTKRSGSVNMWIPDVPKGCKVPMIHLANGTGASCSMYGEPLVRIASHGFLALCYESTNTGAGTQGIEAFDTALKELPDLVDYRFGSTGHSQGGMSSFCVLQFAEEKWGAKGIYAGLAIEPASGFGTNPSEPWANVYAKIKSPMFMFSGQGTDGLVAQTWVQQAYDALDPGIEAYFWAKAGANHMTPTGEINDISISWFRWKLLGDKKACEYFKAIPKNNTSWAVIEEQNQAPCN